MDGYVGRLLRVDLSSGRTWAESLRAETVRGYIGGSGLAAPVIEGSVDANTDPLGPENPLVFLTGPLVGTAMPSAGRYSVCALSPLTGRWGEANSGGFFGPELRFAGYDGIVFTGKAERPTWLSIVDGEVALRDASGLWGLDSYATQREAKAALGGDERIRVACIGQAGENLVRLAAVMNDHGRAAARTGLGAVMGAKRLKAIAVRGHGAVPLADPVAFRAAIAGIVRNLKDDMATTALRLAGTAGYVDMGLMLGDMPVRYFQQGEWEAGSALSGVLMAEHFQVRHTSCFHCPIACGRETRAPRYGVEKVDGPEYETVAALGSLLAIADLEAVIYANHLCNAYGLDTISTGVTIALACELYSRGIIGAGDTGIPEPLYGDPERMIALVGLTARREGFGALLAEGSQRLAARFGVPELAAVLNGLEVPMHDPRAFAGMAAVYALSPRGACHMQGDVYGVDTGQSVTPELGIMPGDRFDQSEEKGRLAGRQMIWRTLYNALTLCQFQNPGAPAVLEALNAATGWGWDAEDLVAAGRRILATKRALNLRRGLRESDERLPALLTQPLADGGTMGTVPDLTPLLAGAYAELGWEPAPRLAAE